MDITQLNNQLNKFSNNIPDVLREAEKMGNKYMSTKGFKVPFDTDIFSKVNGIEVLSKDNFKPDDFPGLNIMFGRLTKAIPELENDLKSELSSVRKDLFALVTETETIRDVAEKFDIITRLNPQAIASSVENILERKVEEIQQLVRYFTTDFLKDLIITSIKNTPFGQLVSQVLVFKQQAEQLIGYVKGGGLLEDIAENLTKNFETSINNLLDTPLSQLKIGEIYSHVAKGEYDKGFKIFSKGVDNPEDKKTQFYNLTTGLENYLDELATTATTIFKSIGVDAANKDAF